MAPPNPKSRKGAPAPSAAVRRRTPTVELPFEDQEVFDREVLHDDDPTSPPVPQYPASRKLSAARKRPNEEAIPTTVYDISEDEELPPSYDAREVSDPGFKPAYLYVEKGPGAGQLVPIKQGALVIGRASVSELRLQHPSVSRRHAQLTRLGERFYLKDLGSQNATYVNKVRIETEIEVYPGDQLQVGNAVLKLRGASDKVGPDIQKKIAKAEVASAKKAAKAARHQAEETDRRMIPRSSTTSALRVGLACTAIGFGLAILGFVALKVFSGQGPQFEQLAARPQAAAAPTAAAMAAAPVAAEPELAIEAEQPVVATAETREEVTARLQLEEPKPAPAEVRPPRAAPEPRQTVSASAVARRDRPARERVVAAAEKKTSAAPKKSNADILKLYEDGNVSGAIAAAEDAGDDDLASKLSDFQTAYNAGIKAEKAGDGTAAIKSFQKALAVDEKISGGWGKHGPAISKKLGNLYTLVGQYYLRDDDAKNAELAFKAAVKYDPQNAVAKKHLATLGTGASKPAVKASAIDDAFADEEEAPAPAKAPAKKKVSTREKAASAIEDAWAD